MSRSVLAATLCLCAFLAGCSGIGELALRQERNDFNDIVDQTGSEQLLQNIIRAHDYERPSFFDLVEIDQTKSASANLAGGSSNIGAPAILGALSSTLSVSDSPILKYQPPSSNGYIAQILLPIPLVSLARFDNSNANLTPLFVFSVNRLTPAFLDYDRAVDLIDFLEDFGAISLEPTADGQLAIVRMSNGILTKDADKLLGGKTLKCFKGGDSALIVSTMWSKLASIFGQAKTGSIQLRAPDAKAASSSAKQAPRSSIVLTRSALGSLRLAESHDISFIDKEKADAIIAQNTGSECFNEELYYKDDDTISIAEKWQKRYDLALNSTEPLDTIRKEVLKLGHSRILILIEQSPTRPANAYVAVLRRGIWYSIDNDDKVSKMNFALLGNLILTQAQTPQSPPTPTVIAAPTAH
jgi:hypothetical protein